jgi:predicted ATPase/class 3 adenylate cyclase
MSNPPAGTVTFLFSDIEGSTQLWERYPDSMPSALAHHDSLMREAIEAQRGYVFKTAGDGFCAAFATAPDALAAALLAQRTLNGTGDSPQAHGVRDASSFMIKVRMGLHTGSAEERDNDYFGTTVNRVARIMSLAHGGQTLLSSAAAELLSGHLPTGVSLRDLGQHRLKGLINPERVWQVVAPGLPSEFPPLASLNAIRTNLPVQLTSFVGRERQVAEVRQLLAGSFDAGPTRLVTIFGPGGAGKTRLSLQVAAEVLDAFQDGVWFVELAPISDPSLAAVAIARTLGISETLGSLLRSNLLDFVREKKLLLVLDNFEQVVEAATLVRDLLTVAPAVQVLVSSRTLLRVPGERSYELPLLSLPDRQHLPAPAQLTQYEAVRLFNDRARAVKPDFAINDENAPAIAEICYQLDGLPLAIELAAARVRLLPPQKMLAPLSNRLKFLTGSARGLPARQQTLRGAIDWSYDLLSPNEQALFRRLAVFAGGATLEAVESVCNTSGDLDVLSGVESLLDKSLLKQTELRGEPRFHMLEMIREYAREKLNASDEAAGTISTHLDYFLELAEQTEAHQYQYGAERNAWFERLLADNDNVLAALDWALANAPERALRLAGAAMLVSVWTRVADVKAGRERLNAALSAAHAAPQFAPGQEAAHARAHALAQMALGVHALGQGDVDFGRAQMEASTAAWRELKDGRRLAFTLSMLALIVVLLGDAAASLALLQESIMLARRLGNTWVLARALHFKGVATSLTNGDYAEARAYLEEGLQLARQADDVANVADAMMNFGRVAARAGDFALARMQYSGGLTLFRELGVVLFQIICRSGLADVARKEGDYTQALALYREVILDWVRAGNRGAIARVLECIGFIAGRQSSAANAAPSLAGLQRAAQMLGTAEGLRGTSGAPMTVDERAEYEPELAALRAAWAYASAPPGVSFESAWQTGRAMSMEQAVAYAIENTTTA